MEVSGQLFTSGKDWQLSLNRRLGGPEYGLALLGAVRCGINMILPQQELSRINKRGNNNSKVRYSVHSSPPFVRIMI